MKVRVLDLGVLKVNESSISLAGELIERQADSSTHPQDQLFKPALLQENNGASMGWGIWYVELLVPCVQALEHSAHEMRNEDPGK